MRFEKGTIPRSTRVRMVGVMPNDPDPIEVGTEGTVTQDGPNEFGQIDVKWDSGRTLMLLANDPFEIIGQVSL
ncbi:MAG: DUF4314 domain-containing protein [Porticoccaceae bacterium]